MEKNIPNYVTLANLFCGVLGIILALDGNGNLAWAGIMVFLGGFFDLLDGLVARLLKVSSPIGKQLDSLADVVTFGVLPSVITYKLLVFTQVDWLYLLYIDEVSVIALITFALTGAAAWRLAKFNLDDSQSTTFRGLPTPANGMFFASLPLVLANDALVVNFDIIYLQQIVLNPYLLVGFVMFFSWLMVSKVPLFSFKFSSMKWQDNKLVYIFLAICLLLFVTLLWASVPIIIFLYVILSAFNKPKPNEIQSAD